MARPKPASRIPDWFNLDAYDRLSGLDANGWLTVVSGLRQLLDETPEFYRIDDEDAGVSLEELEATFISFQEDEGMGWADWKKQDYAVDKDAFNFGSVQSLSNWTVAHMGATLDHIENGPELLVGMRTAVELETKKEFKAARKAFQSIDYLEEFSSTPFFVSLRDSRQNSGSGDLPPVFRANLILVESVSQEDGHEEAIHRRADHRLPEAGGRRHAGQGALPQARLQ